MPIAPHLAAEHAIRIGREQWLDPEGHQRRQWSRFQGILDYAYQRSPFYARKYRAAGIEPADIQERSDLRRLPVVTREELRQPEALVPPPFRPETMGHRLSSGSTGESVKSYFDPEGWLIGKHLLKLRARWACGVRPWDRVALFTASAFSNNALRRRGLRQRSFSVHQPPEEILPELLRFAPTVLYGFPSHFKELAEVWPSRLRPEIIFTSGEMLEGVARAHRERVRRSGLRRLWLDRAQGDRVGVSRARWLPHQQRLGAGRDRGAGGSGSRHFALQPRHATDPLPAGRYRQLHRWPLPVWPLAAADGGRLRPQRGHFRAAGRRQGLALHPDQCGQVLDEIRQFQIVQESIDRVVLVVVPRGEFGRGAEERVRAALGPHLPGIAIEIRIVASIEREPGGKYRMAMSRVERQRT